MRCVMDKRAGGRCPGRSVVVVGGLAVCKYHVRAAERLYREVESSLPGEVKAAAMRDDRERVRG